MQMIPATVLFTYGFLLFVHCVHNHHVMSGASSSSKSLSSSSSSSSSLSSWLRRLLSSRRLQNLLYICAIAVSVAHSSHELVRWNGSLQSLNQLQHVSMYALVSLAAGIGLCMDMGALSGVASYSVGLCLAVAGLMFFAHDQKTASGLAIHRILSLVLCAAGGCYILHSVLLAACGEVGSPSHTAVSPVLLAFSTLASRLTALLIMIAGVWLAQSAFALFSPYAASGQQQQELAHGSPHTAQSLLSMLTMDFLLLTALMMAIEALFRRQIGDWPLPRRAAGGGHGEYRRLDSNNGDRDGAGSPTWQEHKLAADDEDAKELELESASANQQQPH